MYTNSCTRTDRNAGLPTNLYSPCDPNASASMCCAQDPSSPFLNNKSGVDCRSDGLCADAGNDALWRTACTDPTWQNPECIKLCINGTHEAGNDVQVMQCSDGSYCCGSNVNGIASACCNGGQGVWIVNGEETNVNPNASAAPSPAPSSTNTFSLSISDPAALASAQASGQTTGLGVVSSVAQPTTVPISPAKSDKNGDTAAKVGGVVGGVIGLALILGGCWFFLALKRRKPPHPPPMIDEKYSQELGKSPIYEAPTYAGDTKRNELAGLSVSQPELHESRTYYELDQRTENPQKSTYQGN